MGYNMSVDNLVAHNRKGNVRYTSRGFLNPLPKALTSQHGVYASCEQTRQAGESKSQTRKSGRVGQKMARDRSLE